MLIVLIGRVRSRLGLITGFGNGEALVTTARAVFDGMNGGGVRGEEDLMGMGLMKDERREVRGSKPRHSLKEVYSEGVPKHGMIKLLNLKIFSFLILSIRTITILMSWSYWEDSMRCCWKLGTWHLPVL